LTDDQLHDVLQEIIIAPSNASLGILLTVYHRVPLRSGRCYRIIGKLGVSMSSLHDDNPVRPATSTEPHDVIHCCYATVESPQKQLHRVENRLILDFLPLSSDTTYCPGIFPMLISIAEK
jgi:hypothetical protein